MSFLKNTSEFENQMHLLIAHILQIMDLSLKESLTMY